jgi:ribosomal protein L16 Arg81 hydroxylase
VTLVSRAPLLGSAGEELRALLWPVTPETFVHEYWGKLPLFVKGFPEKYTTLFDAEMFSRSIETPNPAHVDFLRASFDKKTSDGKSAAAKSPDELSSSAFRASTDQAVPLFDAGATLCASQIETRVPALAMFLAAIKRQLGYSGKVSFNSYLSPPGAGYNWHFDARVACTLQIEGTKRWRFSGYPAIPWPRANGSIRADGTAQYADPAVKQQSWEQLLPVDQTATTEVLLEPGDLLILPAGFWHEACGGSEGSLALNLTLSPISYTHLVRNLLDNLLTSEAAWRGPAPVLPDGALGGVDPDGIAAITAQLSRAAEVLQSLRGDSAAVIRVWAASVQNANPGYSATQSAPIVTSQVVPKQRLHIRDDGNVYAMLADAGSRLCLAVGASRELELTGVAVQFVQRILAEKEFTAGDCVQWNDGGVLFAWSDVQLMLTNLKREGLIEDVASA